MKKTIIALIFVGMIVLAGGVTYFVYSFHWLPEGTMPLATSENNPPSVAGQDIGIPVRLTIPAIKVDAAVVQVGLAKDGTVGVPDGPYETAWFKLGARPGQQGSAIITGHFGEWRSGAHSVFDNLVALKKGDVVYVKDNNGKVISFVVIDMQTYDSDQSVPQVFNKVDGNYLNLITCNGDWIQSQSTFTKRLVIFTKEI